jgi:hypothetical protein
MRRQLTDHLDYEPHLEPPGGAGKARNGMTAKDAPDRASRSTACASTTLLGLERCSGQLAHARGTRHDALREHHERGASGRRPPPACRSGWPGASRNGTREHRSARSRTGSATALPPPSWPVAHKRVPSPPPNVQANWRHRREKSAPRPTVCHNAE